ncbi:MAG TPA: hypothetical protein VN668_18240 [Stellaceae bacterium]|nr:hypothetical protein [Stellaceae bacterium]
MAMIPRLVLLAVLLLAGCAAEPQPQPLTPLRIRERLAGRLMAATVPGGGQFFIRFGRSGRAEVIGQAREFARWSADDQRGLCLLRQGAPPECAPVYQLNVSHFRWGATALGDLGVPGPERPFDRDRFGPPPLH